MSLFDAMNVAEQAMNVHRYRSEIASQNIANANTPGYKRQEVDLVPGAFGAQLRAASAGTSDGGNFVQGGADAADGAVKVGRVRTVDMGADSSRQQALMGAMDMLQAKTAYEYNARAVAMVKSMALAGLDIGRNA